MREAGWEGTATRKSKERKREVKQDARWDASERVKWVSKRIKEKTEESAGWFVRHGHTGCKRGESRHGKWHRRENERRNRKNLVKVKVSMFSECPLEERRRRRRRKMWVAKGDFDNLEKAKEQQFEKWDTFCVMSVHPVASWRVHAQECTLESERERYTSSRWKVMQKVI